MQQVGDLEIEQDLRFERKEWRVQRVGWVVLVGLLALALAGVFGNGPVSRTTASTDGGEVEVGYQRYVRNRGMSALRVTVAPGSARDGEIRLLVSNDYLDRVEVERMTPEPDSQEAHPDGLVLAFAAADEEAPLELSIGIRPDAVGRLRGEIGLVEGPSVRLRQFAYP